MNTQCVHLLQVAQYYNKVIATDASESQLKHAMPHPRVEYIHTPPSLSAEELVDIVGGENSVDLVTVAQAVHWFDLPKFYSAVTRLLRKPGGIVAVWGYNDIEVNPAVDALMKKFHDTTLPYWNPRIQHLFSGYKTLPFPFQSVGLSSEGQPLELDIPKELSFKGFMGMLESWSAVVTAKDQGVDLLPEDLVKEFETAWGGTDLIRSVAYKAFLLAGQVKL